jgi:hypothetical protein
MASSKRILASLGVQELAQWASNPTVLGDLDSNQDSRSQSPESYHWTIPEEKTI